MIHRAFWLLLCASLIGTGSLSAKEPLGLIVYKRGKAFLVSGGKTRSVQTNDLVGKGDVLKTKSGKLTVQLKAGVVFALSPNTAVSVAALADKAVSLKVQNGSVAGQVKRTKGYKMEFATPTAIASVRGTDVIVEADSDKSKVMVENGTVDVTDPAGEKKESLKDGEKVTSTTQGLQKGIMEAFERQKFEIFKEFNRVKKLNLDLIIEQKRLNRELMKRQLGP